MKVLMFSTDEAIFAEDSPSRRLMESYSTLFEELHVIVYARKPHPPAAAGEHLYLYSAGGWCKPCYFATALWRGARLLGAGGEWLITSQEALTNLVAVPLAKLYGARLQVQLHTDFASPHFRAESWRNRVRAALYQWGIRNAHCIRAVSERVAAAARALAPDTPVAVLPIFVDLPAFGAGVQSTSFNLHTRYPQFNFIVVMVSRLTVEKDYVTALRAFKRLLSRFPRAGLVIVGDGPLRIPLKARAARMRIRDHVMFVGWQRNVGEYLASADVYLLTSRYEGYGRSLIEAAAAGRPIVTTDVGIAGEWLRSEESALVCPVGDVSCIADALARVAGDNAKRQRLALTAKQTVQERAGIPFPDYLDHMRRTFATCAASAVASDASTFH